MRHIFLVIFSYAVVFLGIGTVIHLVSIDKIERSLEVETTSALRDTLNTLTGGVDLEGEVAVNFSGTGLHGKVTGSVPDIETIAFYDRAVTSINHEESSPVPKVASLTSDLRLSARCTVFVKDRTPYVRALMSPSIARELQAAIKATLKRDAQDACMASGNEEDQLSPEFLTQPNVEEPAWSLPMCEFLKDFLTHTREADFSINHSGVLVSGLVDHSDVQTRLIARARELFSHLNESEIDTSGLEVDMPIITSHIIMRTDSEGFVTIEGQVTSQHVADHISDSVERSLQSHQALNSNLQISSKVQPTIWHENFEAYTKLLFANISHPQLQVQANRVTVAGQVPDQRTLNEVAGKTAAQFVDFAVENQLKLVRAQQDTNAVALLSEQVDATDILFDVNQSIIKASEAPKLEALAEALKQSPDTQVVVFGFADPTGNADTNLRLSRKRCEAARDRLIQLGVKAATLEIIQRDADTSVNTEDPGSLTNERRVEFELKASTE